MWLAVWLELRAKDWAGDVNFEKDHLWKLASSLKLLCHPFTSNSLPSPVDLAPIFLCSLPSSLPFYHCSCLSSSFILSCPVNCTGIPAGPTTVSMRLLHFDLNISSQSDFYKMQIQSVFPCPKLYHGLQEPIWSYLFFSL